MTKKELRIFLTVVLAIASVSLVTQIFAGIVASIKVIDGYDPSLFRIVGFAFITVITVISIAFAVTQILQFMPKNNKSKGLMTASSALCGVVAVLFIAFAIVYHLAFGGDSVFERFLTVGLADVIAICLILISRLILTLKLQPEQDKSNCVSAVEKTEADSEISCDAMSD